MPELTTGALCRGARGSDARIVLGWRASLVVSMGVVAHTLWTSAAPAMVYQLFAEQWHLRHTVTTGIFAIYPSCVVAVLVLFGDLSDHIGRRATMLLGLGASLAGSLMFATAPDVGWLFAAAALMGIGVGLTAGPSTAAIVEFGKDGASKRAALITTMSQAFGFAAALLLGGALVQYAPWPTRLSFWVLTVLLTLLFAAAWFLPRKVRKAFAVAAVAMMTAYTHGVLVLSLGGQVARDLVGSPNACANGAVLSLFAIVSGALGVIARSLPARRAMMLGAIASTAKIAKFLKTADDRLAEYLDRSSRSGPTCAAPCTSPPAACFCPATWRERRPSLGRIGCCSLPTFRISIARTGTHGGSWRNAGWLRLTRRPSPMRTGSV